MKNYLLCVALIVSSSAFAATPEDCTNAANQYRNTVQNLKNSTAQLSSKLSQYSFIPKEQQNIQIKNANDLLQMNEKTLADGLQSMQGSPADQCVNNFNYYNSVAKTSLSMNIAILNEAQKVEQNKNAIIQQSKCNNTDLCSKTLYFTFAKQLREEVNKNAENIIQLSKQHNNVAR